LGCGREVRPSTKAFAEWYYLTSAADWCARLA
jgi:hypothetical protein